MLILFFLLILIQLGNDFMKITWLLMLGSAILCVLGKTLEMKLLFSKEQQRTNNKTKKILGPSRHLSAKS